MRCEVPRGEVEERQLARRVEPGHPAILGPDDESPDVVDEPDEQHGRGRRPVDRAARSVAAVLGPARVRGGHGVELLGTEDGVRPGDQGHVGRLLVRERVQHVRRPAVEHVADGPVVEVRAHGPQGCQAAPFRLLRLLLQLVHRAPPVVVTQGRRRPHGSGDGALLCASGPRRDKPIPLLICSDAGL